MSKINKYYKALAERSYTPSLSDRKRISQARYLIVFKLEDFNDGGSTCSLVICKSRIKKDVTLKSFKYAKSGSLQEQAMIRLMQKVKCLMSVLVALEAQEIEEVLATTQQTLATRSGGRL